MKTGLLSTLFRIIPTLAIAFCFIPFLYLGWKKMRQVSVYRAIALYWLTTGLINLFNIGSFRWLRESIQERFNLWYTLVETPLVLLALFCAASGSRRRQLVWVMPLFIIFECVMLAWQGYNYLSSNIIIAAGLLITLVYCITGLIDFMRQMEHTPQENAAAFIYAALLFAYSSYLIIYIFIHVHEKGADIGRDSYLLYYIGLLLSVSVTNLGLWGYGIRQPRTSEYNN